MNGKKTEIRTIPCELAVRELPEDQAGESRTIAGTAIVFNAESQELDDFGVRFREVIMPSACTMEFLRTQDIKLNMLHDRQLTLARCNKGQGSLRLSVDEKGVQFEFDAPKCDIGDRCLEMVRRGDYSGCSFEFWPGDYDTERNGDELVIRHKTFERLFGLTIGMDPAYLQTSVNAREMMSEGEDETPEEEPETPQLRDAREIANAERNRLLDIDF